MKKILLSVLLLGLTVVGVFVPYQTGVIAEQQVQQLHQQLAAATSFKLLDNQHQRGWFNSNNAVGLHLPEIKSRNVPALDLQLTHDINHGLYPLYRPLINSTLSIQAPEYTELLKLRTWINADQSVTTLLGAPMVNLSEGEEHFYWEGLQGEVHVAADRQAIQTHLQMPQLEMTAPNSRFLLDDITIQAQLEQQTLGMIPKLLQFKLKHTEILPPKQIDNNFEKIEFINSVLSLQSHIATPDNLTMALEFGNQHSIIDDVFKSTEYASIELRQLNLPALNAIQNSLRQAHFNVFDWQVLNTLMQQSLSLLQNQPELEISVIGSRTPAEEYKVNATVKLLRFQPAFFFSPMSIIEHLQGQLNIQIGHVLLVKLLSYQPNTNELAAEARIEQAIATNRLKVHPTRRHYYQIEGQLLEGQLTLNGLTKPFSEWFPDLLR